MFHHIWNRFDCVHREDASCGGGGGFFFWLWLCRIFAVACRTYSCGMWDIVSWPGIKPSPSALGAWSLRHWSPGESQGTLEFLVIYCLGTPEAVLVVMRQGPSCSPAPSFSFKPMRFNLLGKSSNWKKVHKLLGHRWLKGISHWFACRNLGKRRIQGHLKFSTNSFRGFIT